MERYVCDVCGEVVEAMRSQRQYTTPQGTYFVIQRITVNEGVSRYFHFHEECFEAIAGTEWSTPKKEVLNVY